MRRGKDNGFEISCTQCSEAVMEDRVGNNSGAVFRGSSTLTHDQGSSPKSDHECKIGKYKTRTDGLGGGMNSVSRTPWIMLVLVLFLSFENCNGFNLDVDNTIPFESVEQGSYYGYTVAMLKRDTNTKW